ncbi:NACHT domain-containing NTPase, partial [Salmonella enterica]
KDVYLDQIYYPLNISSYRRKNIIIDDYETLEHEQRVCLVGVAGQGKTMTMKKMFLEDLNKFLFFPVFLSLRNLDFSKELSLVEVLETHFIINGVDCGKADVTTLLKNNPVRLYLDGFDEIPVSHRKQAINFLD